jgi:hypothetical protein
MPINLVPFSGQLTEEFHFSFPPSLPHSISFSTNKKPNTRLYSIGYWVLGFGYWVFNTFPLLLRPALTPNSEKKDIGGQGLLGGWRQDGEY